MTFNILKGGVELGQPLAQTVKVIQTAQADLVILQEQNGAAKPLARALEFDCHVVSDRVAILSRFPIVDRFDSGVAVAYQPGRKAYAFGVHLEAYPYGPYDLRDYPALTPEQLVATARDTRDHQIKPVLEEMRSFVAEGAPVFLGGDFNEPSHLDWTQQAAEGSLNFGAVVLWPTSRAVADAGLSDSYRTAHADPVAMRGLTWTPLPAPNEVHDRIDLLYHAGTGVEVVTAEVVGEDPELADIVVQPYPSDHRGVVASYQIPN
jgi:endonuclease/exonuclease/phosphatase family metal-dependent hydrolase